MSESAREKIERLVKEIGPVHSAVVMHPVRCPDCAVYALRDEALRLAVRLESFRDIERRELVLLEENEKLRQFATKNASKVETLAEENERLKKENKSSLGWRP